MTCLDLPTVLFYKDKRNMNGNPVNIGTRLASMALDHVIMSVLIGVLIAPFTVATAATDISNTRQSFTELFGTGNGFYIMLAGLSIYLCKDCIGGRSLAKRILKQQVLDHKTNAPATPLQCLLRNFSIVFWPIEVIAVFISPGRRLGDRLAGTRVASFDKNAQVASINYFQVALCLLLGFAYLFLITKPLQ